MNSQEKFGGDLSDEEKRRRSRAYEEALAKLKQRPEVKRGEMTQAIERANHGIDAVPLQTPTPQTDELYNVQPAPLGGVRAPSTPPQKYHTEVDQPELIRNIDEDWVKKDKEE